MFAKIWYMKDLHLKSMDLISNKRSYVIDLAHDLLVDHPIGYQEVGQVPIELGQDNILENLFDQFQDQDDIRSMRIGDIIELPNKNAGFHDFRVKCKNCWKQIPILREQILNNLVDG